MGEIGPCGARFAETELSAILPRGGGWEIGWGDHKVITGGGVGGTPKHGVDSAELFGSGAPPMLRVHITEFKSRIVRCLILLMQIVSYHIVL